MLETTDLFFGKLVSFKLSLDGVFLKSYQQFVYGKQD